MRSYRIPNEVSTELKINKVLYLFDLMFIIGLILFRQITISFIHSNLTLYYTIFLGIFGLFMLIRPSTNPQKRMYQSLLFGIVRKKESYSSIDYSVIDNEENERGEN